MFHFKFFYLKTYIRFCKIEICLPDFAEGFKLKFVDMMANVLS